MIKNYGIIYKQIWYLGKYVFCKNTCRSVPLLWKLFAGLSLRTYRFNRVPIHVATWAFVVDKTVLKHAPPLPPEYLSYTLS